MSANPAGRAGADSHQDVRPKRSGGRLRRLLVRAGILLLSGLVALAALETWTRKAHPFGIQYYAETNRYLNESIQILPEATSPTGRIFENRPASRLELARFELCTDGVGLRAPAPTDAVPPAREPGGPLRLLFVGDSVTLGWGVDDQDTWIRRLEREASAADGRSLECMNAGHLMYNTTQQADWVDAHAAALAPDAVVLTFVANDVEDDHWGLYQQLVSAQADAAAGAEETLGRRLIRMWSEHLPGTRRLWLFTQERIATRRAVRNGPVVVEEVPGYAEGWERCSTALERARARCDALGIPFIVFDHTTPRIDAVRSWCEANEVPWFDHRFTPEQWEQDVRVSLADSHANPLGHRFLFEAAWRSLAEAGLLSTALVASAGADDGGAEDR